METAIFCWIYEQKNAGRALFWLWLRGLDLNQGPSGYEPDELPDCSTPREERPSL